MLLEQCSRAIDILLTGCRFLMAFEQFASDLQVRVVQSIVCDLQGALYAKVFVGLW
jgi:hypothetical protein